MRILTWNIRHGGGTRADAISAQLLTHEPDLVVLTEYRENPAGASIRERLATSGLEFARSSVNTPKVNGVLVAARESFAVCEVPHLGESSHRALWCRFPTFDVVGYYFPNKLGRTRFSNQADASCCATVTSDRRHARCGVFLTFYSGADASCSRALLAEHWRWSSALDGPSRRPKLL